MLSDAKGGGVASAAPLAPPRAVVANKSREIGEDRWPSEGRATGEDEWAVWERANGQLRGGPRGELMGS